MKDLDKLNLRVLKYRVDKLILTIEDFGEFTVDPLYVSQIVLEKDYDKFMFPYFELMVGIPPKVFRAMKKKNIKNTCYIRIKYAYFERNSNYLDEQTKEPNPSEKVWLAKNFFIYGVEGTPATGEETEEKLEKDLDLEESAGDINHLVTTYFLLYDEAALQRVTKIYNEIITDCTLTDAITRVLNLGGFKNVLMTPADNGRVYHEFTLLPVRTDEQLLHICNDYHMHNTGTRIFFDFEYTYIVSKAMKCDAWRPGEYKKTYVIYDPPDLAARLAEGSCEDGETESNYCTMVDFVLATPGYEEDQIYGVSYTHLDPKTGNISTINSDVQTINGGTPIPSRIIYNNTAETSTAQQMGINQTNNTAMWEVLINNVNIEFLTPNKEFEFYFNSEKLSKYNSRYKIASFITIFEKVDSLWFKPYTKAKFNGKNPIKQ